MAVVEFARNVAKIDKASSGEITPNNNANVIDIMPEQEGYEGTGGTMRLGGYPTTLKPGTLIASIYEREHIVERHRHRYEVMEEFVPQLEKHGLVISGRFPERNLVETMELKDHPWFIGCQYHPELKSKPLKPHPLFATFIGAAYNYKQNPNQSKVLEEQEKVS